MRNVILLLLLFSVSNSKGQYNYYFGNIHAHTEFSDGSKDSATTGYSNPADAYRFAKASYQMDFLGISEHNHFTATRNPGMRRAAYTLGLFQADTSNNNGTFVSLFGMEWGTIGTGGHVLIYGVPGLIGWEVLSNPPGNNYDIYCNRGDYTSLWAIVQSYPTAFCSLAHPQSGDFGSILSSAPYNALADSVITGVSIRSGAAFSTTTDYSDPPPGSYESSYLRALARGYHLGPGMDHDNHYTTFGRTGQTRTVVLATSLHRDSIMAAYRAGRFYASDDWNTRVSFTVNGAWMSNEINTGANSSISVSVNDPDPGDGVSTIQIYAGVPGSLTNATVLASNSGSSTFNFTHPTALNNSFYYFAKITQTDGHIIWTSPVWINRTSITLPVQLISFTGQRLNERVALRWTTAQEVNSDYFVVERSINGRDFTALLRLPAAGNSSILQSYTADDLQPFRGMNFYRLKQVDRDGQVAYSDIVAINADRDFITRLRISPNPARDIAILDGVAAAATRATINIYDAEGRQVMQQNVQLTAGDNRLPITVSRLAPGTYFVVLHRPNERLGETRLVKH
jgi:hypothetical protein